MQTVHVCCSRYEDKGAHYSDVIIHHHLHNSLQRNRLKGELQKITPIIVSC